MENTLMKSPRELLTVVEKSGLADHQKAQVYVQLFAPNLARLSELEKEILLINDTNPTAEDAAKARELRLLYVKNRTASERTKDETKKNLLVETNLIQSLYNVVLNASKLKEEHLSKIEKHQELAEAKMKADRLIIRLADLKPFTNEGDAIPEALIAEMNDEMFATFLGGMKTKFNDAQFELQKQAKQKQEQEENNKKRRERGQKLNGIGLLWNGEDYVYETVTIPGIYFVSWADKKFEAELAKADTEVKKIKAIKKKDADLAQENANKVKQLQDSIRLQKEKEEKEEEDRLNMGDKQKFTELINELQDLQTKYTFKSKKHKQIYSGIGELLGKTITYAKEKLK